MTQQIKQARDAQKRANEMTEEQIEDPVKQTLGTLIVWIAQSANSPISVREAEELLKMLDVQNDR